MRILHLCTDAYGGFGGIALYNRDFLEAAASHPECEEIVVLPRLIRTELQPIPPKVRFVTEAARGAVAYVRSLFHAVRRQRFDIVICAHVNLLPLTRLVTRYPVLMIYGIEAWKPLRDPFSNRLVHNVHTIVSISDITLQRFLGWSHIDRPWSILPNAIHKERYGIRARRRDLVERYGLRGKRVLMTLGRIVAAERYKGFDEVIEILPDLLTSAPDVVYIVAGGGNDIPRLQVKAAALGVGAHVIFTGKIEEREKADLYNLADVYVMPSRGEGFGFVLLEAMACGVPVIAGKHDGGREAVRMGELGLLVDAASPSEIRAAILEVLAQGKREIPAGLEYFSFKNFETRVHSLLTELRGGN